MCVNSNAGKGFIAHPLWSMIKETIKYSCYSFGLDKWRKKFLTTQYYTFMLPFISDLTGANAVGPKTSVGQEHNETENTN